MCGVPSALTAFGRGQPDSITRGEYRSTRRQISECHRSVVRTGLSARFANFIREAAMAAATDRVGVETVVGCVHEEHVVTVNIHSRRTCPAPGEVSCAAAMDLV